MTTESHSASPNEGAQEHRVSPLELFFDLVFVFALTQVTASLARDPTWEGLLRGMLVLAALWWAWVGYAWLTNAVDAEDDPTRVAVFAAMSAMLVASLAVPEAFDREAVVFAAAYLAVRVAHVALFLVTTRAQPEVNAAVRRLAPGILIAPALLLVAATLDGPAQGAVWVVALLTDFLSPVVAGSGGWRVSAGHFAERHGLIVIIALGESIVAIGVGAAGLPLDAGLVVGAVLGVLLAASLWWAYFDVVAIAAERRLHRAQGAERNAIARDSYSYLHLPMVAGIVLIALGVKTTIAHVGDPLHGVQAVALCGGLALYLLGHIGFRLRNMGTLNRQRLVVAVLALAALPLALSAPALATLAALTALMWALIGYEAVRYREGRRRLRTQAAGA